MIGDWVKVDDTEAYYQVEYITKELDELRVHLKDTCCFATENDIHPIPLSVDILKKNGFDQNGIPEDKQPVEERDYCDDTYVWSDFDNEVSVYWDCTTDDFIFEAHVPRFDTDGICINHVHELQNLLRLCRIKKENSYDRQRETIS